MVKDKGVETYVLDSILDLNATNVWNVSEHEIKRAWELGKPIMGIRINALEDASGRQSRVGQNPFEKIWLDNGTLMSQWVPVFTPNPYGTSRDAYNDIRINMGTWVESAIVAQRNLRRMPLV